MIRLKTLRASVFLLSLAHSLLSFGCSTEGTQQQDRVLIMSYNVKNLFDAKDEGTEFEDFSVKKGRWSEALYKQRLSLLKEVIEKGGKRIPDIVVLAEIENKAVLERIAGLVEGMSNAFTAIAPASGNAFACGLLSRYPIIATRAHAATGDSTSSQRNMLETRIRIEGCDLIVFSCHWKSKLGGPQETEGQRIRAAALLRMRIQEILSEEPLADILIAGDLNESADESIRAEGSYKTALTAAAGPGSGETEGLLITGERGEMHPSSGSLILFSPWLEPGSENLFSYSYQGSKETLDHFLLSPGLFDDFAFRYGGFSVAQADFLKDGSGNPKEWNTASRCGYSDHFPILLELELPEF